MRAFAIGTVLAVGCAPPPEAVGSCGHVETDRPVLVLERGDQTSAIARLSGGCFTETPPDIVLGYDQNLLGAGSRAFVGLNEQGSLREIDPDALTLGASFDVYRDMPGSTSIHGIYGVAIDDADNLWVSRADAGRVAILRPDGSLDGTVDLSDLDDDGVPEMNGILIQGGRAYVALGFLPTDDLSDAAKRRGAIVVLDTATRERVSVIDLAGKNPAHALMPAEGGTIVVATPGDHDAIDEHDGIDRVWLDGSRPTEQIVDERELGGSVDDVVWGGPTEAYAIVLGPEPGLNPTRVVAIDPEGGRVTRVLAEAPYFADRVNGAAYVHVGLALAGDVVLVADKTPGAAGIRAFSRATGEAFPPIPARVEAPASLLPLR